MEEQSNTASALPKWTVIGGYFDYEFDDPDNTWVEWVRASTPQEAEQTAIRKIVQDCEADTPPQPVVLAVFGGWHVEKLTNMGNPEAATNMPLAVRAIEDIATDAFDAMGDVFYEPDIDIDGYDPTMLFSDVKQTIVEAINKALQQAGVPRPDHLATVLELAQKALADQLGYLVSMRNKLNDEEFATFYKAMSRYREAGAEAIAGIAQIVGAS